jgi:hypothetical protein
MKKIIVLAVVVAFGLMPSPSKALTVEEVQDTIKETVNPISLTALQKSDESTGTSTEATTTLATTTAASSTKSTLIIVPEDKSNEVTINLFIKSIKKIFGIFKKK